MRVHKRAFNILPRPVVFAVLVWWEAGILWAVFEAIQGIESSAILWCICTVHQVVWFGALVAADWATATVIFSPQGIEYRCILSWRKYAWSAIRQVGLVCCWRKGLSYWSYAFVPKGGRLHTHLDAGDRNFCFRHQGVLKNLYVPKTLEVLRYIEQYYGELDFM